MPRPPSRGRSWRAANPRTRMAELRRGPPVAPGHTARRIASIPLRPTSWSRGVSTRVRVASTREARGGGRRLAPTLAEDIMTTWFAAFGGVGSRPDPMA